MQQPRIGSRRKSKKDVYTIFDTEIESTSPKSEQDSGILDVEDEEDDEEVTNIWTGEIRSMLGLIFEMWGRVYPCNIACTIFWVLDIILNTNGPQYRETVDTSWYLRF